MSRRMILFAITITALLGFVIQQVPAQAATTVTAKVLVFRLNLRADANSRAAKLGVLKRGETLTVLGKESTKGVWFKVQTGTGTVGWVASRFVTLTAGKAKDVSVTK